MASPDVKAYTFHLPTVKRSTVGADHREPLDFTRHQYRIVASRVRKLLAGSSLPRVVLDVGGYRNDLLKRNVFSDISRVSLNIPPDSMHHGTPDILYDGSNFPLADNAVPVVISVDVLEHLLPDERPAFVKELIRISQRGVVISCPFESEANRLQENTLIQSLQGIGVPHDSLIQHRRLGLPTLELLEKIAIDTGLEYDMFPATDTKIAFEGLQNQINALSSKVYPKTFGAMVSDGEAILENNPPSSWESAYRAILVIYKTDHNT